MDLISMPFLCSNTIRLPRRAESGTLKINLGLCSWNRAEHIVQAAQSMAQLYRLTVSAAKPLQSLSQGTNPIFGKACSPNLPSCTLEGTAHLKALGKLHKGTS